MVVKEGLAVDFFERFLGAETWEAIMPISKEGAAQEPEGRLEGIFHRFPKVRALNLTFPGERVFLKGRYAQRFP